MTSAVRRAVCVAGGERCAETFRPRACVTRSGERRQRAEMAVVVRIGADTALLREHRSDGTVALTLVDDAGVDAELGIGAEGSLGGREGVRDGGAAEDGGAGGSGAKASARLGATVGRRLRWELPSSEAADRFQRRLLSDRDALLILGSRALDVSRLAGGGAPPSDAWAVRLGVSGDLEGTVGLPAAAKAALRGSLGGAGEVWWDRRRRRATVAIEASASASAAVEGPLGAALGGRVEAMRRNELVLDDRGRPLELVVRARGSASVTASRPTVPGAERRPAWGRGTGDREIDARLDLTDPVLRGATGDLLRGLREGDREAAGRALRELGRYVATDAAIDVRRYRTTGTRRDLSGSMAAGVKVGLGVETSRTVRRLVDARSRPPGGVWERRLDCGVGA